MHIEITQNPDEVRKCFEELKQTGRLVQITEFDMCVPERFMFDDSGRARSEQEMVEFINRRAGMTIRSIAELKESRMSAISKAIRETGAHIEGVTYWSISDKLDHNLERTNRKTITSGLDRDIATTRFSGLYSSLDKEQPVQSNKGEDEEQR